MATEKKSSSTSRKRQKNIGLANVPLTDSGTVNSVTNADIMVEAYRQSIIKMDSLEKAVDRLEDKQNKTKEFYEATTKLSKTAYIILWILLIIPALQLFGCIAVVYYLGIQDNLPGLLYWVLSSVSLLSVGEIISIPKTFSSIKNRLNDIEKRLDKFERDN